MNIVKNKFTKIFKELREERGLTKTALAKELGFSHVALVNWEKGKRTPDVDTMIAIASYFNVTLDFLCGLTDI